MRAAVVILGSMLAGCLSVPGSTPEAEPDPVLSAIGEYHLLALDVVGESGGEVTMGASSGLAGEAVFVISREGDLRDVMGRYDEAGLDEEIRWSGRTAWVIEASGEQHTLSGDLKLTPDGAYAELALDMWAEPDPDGVRWYFSGSLGDRTIDSEVLRQKYIEHEPSDGDECRTSAEVDCDTE